jgi:hypothetical protein
MSYTRVAGARVRIPSSAFDQALCAALVGCSHVLKLRCAAGTIPHHVRAVLWGRVASALETAPPRPDEDELAWVSRTFSEPSAAVLFLAARELGARGELGDALVVIDDACNAERRARQKLEETFFVEPGTVARSS